MENALFNDIKTIRPNDILPSGMAQLCVWDARRALTQLPQIRKWFENGTGTWMINIIDICQRCSYFVCEDGGHQREIERVFDVCFEDGVAQTSVPYLRKEIIKKAIKKR